ncbi:MAG: hypothetical protein H0U65_04920, partial [Rubrobacter sp.]|nr:hypothetical protein [Rubrobacter sp.]
MWLTASAAFFAPSPSGEKVASSVVVSPGASVAAVVKLWSKADASGPEASTAVISMSSCVPVFARTTSLDELSAT